MSSTERVAANVRTIARARGIKLKDLAGRLGMSEPVFYKRLKGDSRLTVEELEAIAENLNTTAGTLLADPSDLLERLSRWIHVRPDETLGMDEMLVSESLVQAA